MKLLTKVETINLSAGDQCSRLVRRMNRANRQGRYSAGDRLFQKWKDKGCALF